MDVTAKGFAVVSFGRLDVATVSPTRRGAIVNWLVSSARQPVYQWTSDEAIEKMWRQLTDAYPDDNVVVEVNIEPIKRRLSPARQWDDKLKMYVYPAD